MKVAVVGTGHAGLATAACLAHVGHEVLGVDGDGAKVETIARGEVPFHEPGLLDLVREGLANGRLRISAETAEAGRFAEVVFICVGTPPLPSGESDLSQVESAARAVARGLEGYTVIAQKSTVPVQTGAWLRDVIESAAPASARFDVVSNPEFLREGKAVQDTLEPERVVIGARSTRAAELVADVYRPIVHAVDCPVIVTGVETAELVKLASNAFLATKISFVNMVADLCDATGADVEVVAEAMGMDPRIGPAFLRAGLGYGGGCLPKDVAAFRHKGEELGVDLAALDGVDRVNRLRPEALLRKVRAVAGNLRDRAVAVWGLSFKPDTDDLRKSPALGVVEGLLDAGARVTVHDPEALPVAREELRGVTFAADPYEAAEGAEALCVCTDWELYAAADLKRLRSAMAKPVVVDGRNVFDPKEMREAGFTYASVGRPTVTPGLSAPS